MKKEEIRLDDWHRILFGEAPAEFLLEVLLRALLVYFFLLVVVRLLGKRMSGQLTLTEMSVMLTIGAVISPSLQAPERGILLAFVAMLCTLAFQRGTTWLAFKNEKFEHLTQGKTTLLVKDGILQLDNLADTRITRQQIFAELRTENIYILSGVKRLYLEPAGDFSIYPADDKKPGLSTLPPSDPAVLDIQQTVPDTMACKTCGNTKPADKQETNCPVCHEQNWTPAVQ